MPERPQHRIRKQRGSISSVVKGGDASSLNMKLASMSGGIRNDITEGDLQSVITDPNFTLAIEVARKNLGLTSPMPPVVDETDADRWIVGQLLGRKPGHSEYTDFHQLLDDELAKVIESTRLHQWGWEEFLLAFIALNDKPQTISPRKAPLISVEQINTEEQELVIRLKGGLQLQEYTSAWKLFKSHLERLSELVFLDKLNDKMLHDSSKGMSPRQITKKYFPEEYNAKLVSGKIDTIRRDNKLGQVKKLITRNRGKDSGTKK